MKHLLYFLFLLPLCAVGQRELAWLNVDSAYGPLPNSVHVYLTNDNIDTSAFKAFYVIADLKDKGLDFTTDTTLGRRFTPLQFYEKNKNPLVVVNGTFFSFETNRNLNVVVKNGKLLSYNIHSIPGRGKDTLTYRHPFAGALGIDKKRKADVAWIANDSTKGTPYATQLPVNAIKDSIYHPGFDSYVKMKPGYLHDEPRRIFRKWKMKAAIGGGPVLLQNGKIEISNNEELKFTGKAINDKHPRTAMGYTKDNKLIILVIEGRTKEAGGATLTQEAQILKDLGCVEALNLDGGGSSCLLVNGKETIKPSDAKGQRPIPAVFMIMKN